MRKSSTLPPHKFRNKPGRLTSPCPCRRKFQQFKKPSRSHRRTCQTRLSTRLFVMQHQGFMVQMTRGASQLQSIDEAIHTPIVTQRQISSKQTVQKNGRIPRSKLVDVHAATQREVPSVHKVETTVGGPKMQFVNEVETRKTPGRPQLRDENCREWPRSFHRNK